MGRNGAKVKVGMASGILNNEEGEKGEGEYETGGGNQ